MCPASQQNPVCVNPAKTESKVTAESMWWQEGCESFMIRLIDESMTTTPETTFTAHQSAGIALHEYNRLYDLVIFRMSSLDRRAPIGGAALGTFLTVIGVLPAPTQRVMLLALPLALIWFLRTTINHARSFEDILARLGELERRINQSAGENLLEFQSRHPSRDSSVGGRTGRETVGSVYGTCLLLLLACGYLAYAWNERWSSMLESYWMFLWLDSVYLTHCFQRLSAYRYIKTHLFHAMMCL